MFEINFTIIVIVINLPISLVMAAKALTSVAKKKKNYNNYREPTI